jgi:ABC-type glycerol-3-phosphate transport system substrate-binding protein
VLFLNKKLEEDNIVFKKFKNFWVIFLMACIILVGVFTLGVSAENIKLVYMTAGDVNMLALGQQVIGPQFTEKYPNVSVMTVHVGPGNAGSRLIFEKIMADKDKKEGDIDIAMVHQIFLKWAIEEGDLLLNYAKDINTWKYVTSPFAKKSLGVDVEGYCMPMFHSQTVLVRSSICSRMDLLEDREI